MPAEEIRICDKTVLRINEFQLFLFCSSRIVSGDGIVGLIEHFLLPRLQHLFIPELPMDAVALADQILHGI